MKLGELAHGIHGVNHETVDCLRGRTVKTRAIQMAHGVGERKVSTETRARMVATDGEGGTAGTCLDVRCGLARLGARVRGTCGDGSQEGVSRIGLLKGTLI